MQRTLSIPLKSSSSGEKEILFYAPLDMGRIVGAYVEPHDNPSLDDRATLGLDIDRCEIIPRGFPLRYLLTVPSAFLDAPGSVEGYNRVKFHHTEVMYPISERAKGSELVVRWLPSESKSYNLILLCDGEEELTPERQKMAIFDRLPLTGTRHSAWLETPRPATGIFFFLQYDYRFPGAKGFDRLARGMSFSLQTKSDVLLENIGVELCLMSNYLAVGKALLPLSSDSRQLLLSLRYPENKTVADYALSVGFTYNEQR